MKIGKKSQIGATLTWIVALFLICILMAVYILAAMGLAEIRGVSKDFVQEAESGNAFLNAEFNAVLKAKDSKDDTLINEIKNLQASGAKDIPQDLRDSAEEILGYACDGYILEIPQGIISPAGINMPAKDLTGEIEFKMPYNGKIIEIKYSRLKKCS